MALLEAVRLNTKTKEVESDDGFMVVLVVVSKVRE